MSSLDIAYSRTPGIYTSHEINAHGWTTNSRTKNWKPP